LAGALCARARAAENRTGIAAATASLRVGK